VAERGGPSVAIAVETDGAPPRLGAVRLGRRHRDPERHVADVREGGWPSTVLTLVLTLESPLRG
jgi:hypothetical protein